MSRLEASVGNCSGRWIMRSPQRVGERLLVVAEALEE